MAKEKVLLAAAIECEKGNYKQGIHLYSQFLMENPNYAQAYYQRGKAYFLLKDYNAATSDITKALSNNPGDAHLHGERGLVYHMAGNKVQAIADFDEAVKLEPKNPYRYASRAFIKDNLGDLAGAITDYEKAISLDPDDAISHNNLGLVLEKTSGKNKAQLHYEKAGEIDPKNFGMRPQASSREILQKEEVRTNTNAEFAENEAKNLNRSFWSSLKGLFTSKEERTAFLSFLRAKFNKK